MRIKTETNIEAITKVLMKKSKETIISLYIKAHEKADAYEDLRELLLEMLEPRE